MKETSAEGIDNGTMFLVKVLNVAFLDWYTLKQARTYVCDSAVFVYMFAQPDLFLKNTLWLKTWG